MQLLMIFIDGLGLGSVDPEINPLTRATMPFIRGLCSDQPLTKDSVGAGIAKPGLIINPTDVSLGVPGIPQSATGQTTFLSGVNAAAVAGRHLSGFPSKALRTILQQHSIFKRLNQAGRRAVFANTFTKEYFEVVNHGKWRHSATTTAALAGESRIFFLDDLLQHHSIYQDITNENLLQRGYQVPLYEPETAAAILFNQALRYDFTLFEYFQTDHCGHGQDWELALTLLNRLDRLLGSLHTLAQSRPLTILIVSDHGNIEDLSVKTHSYNSVPTIALGTDLTAFGGITSIIDIYPAILEHFGLKQPGFLDPCDQH